MHFQHATDAFTLKNGVKIPCIGFPDFLVI